MSILTHSQLQFYSLWLDLDEILATGSATHEASALYTATATAAATTATAAHGLFII